MVFILSKRAKIVTCHSVWHAYRDAYMRVNHLLLRDRELSSEERWALAAYKDIISYGQWREYRNVAKNLCAVSYMRTYCDALRLYNRINAINSRSQAFGEFSFLDLYERDFMLAFRNLLVFACDKQQKIGRFDRVKVYNFTKKLDAALNFTNRGRK